MRRLFSTLLLASVLTFSQGAHADTLLSPVFTDLNSNHVYYDGVMYLGMQGVLSGYDDGTVRPDEPVRRDEALKMILSSAQAFVDKSTFEEAFSDVPKDHWAAPYVFTASEEGIVNGRGDGLFHPEDTVTRAEALKMLILTNDILITLEDPAQVETEWYLPYLNYGITNALLTPDAALDYLPNAALSRGELADLIYRFYNKPYTGAVEFGKATYYGWSYDGHNTASGTPLEAAGNMAAHKTLPFGTRVKVTNLANNSSVIVTIVDRGPYGEGRVIDMTPGSFERIGALWQGVLNVRLEVLN